MTPEPHPSVLVPAVHCHRCGWTGPAAFTYHADGHFCPRCPEHRDDHASLSKVEPMEAKQVIVVRKDLNMRKGKIGAQVAHASMGVLLNAMKVRGDERVLRLEPGTPLHAWVVGRFKKIVVSVNSEAELLALHERAQAAGLPNCLIQDSGLTEFGGVPTYTTLAIGPALDPEIDPLTKHLPLM